MFCHGELIRVVTESLLNIVREGPVAVSLKKNREDIRHVNKMGRHRLWWNSGQEDYS